MTQSSALREIERKAAEFGFAKVRVNLEGNQIDTRWRIVCATCGKESDHRWQPATGPSMMVGNMRRAGWTVAAKTPPKCPACTNKREAKAVTTPKPEHGPTPQIARRLIAVLDDHFIEATRRYKPGWDDAKIAQEIGVSVITVETFRRSAYGELAEDPVMAELRDGLELLRMEIEDTRKAQDAKLADFEKRLTNAKVAK